MLCVASQASAQLYKCIDEHGGTTYSDKMCPEVRKKASATPSKAENPVAKSKGPVKLTPASVEAVVRQAISMAMRGDYQGQCALAAPELKFSITETNSNPPKVMSGGKREFCAAQRKSAIDLQEMQVNVVWKLGKLDLAIQPDGSRASVKYEITGAARMDGETLLMLRCSRSEVLGIFSDEILFVLTESVCRPGA